MEELKKFILKWLGIDCIDFRLRNAEKDLFKIKYPHELKIGSPVMLSGLGEKPKNAVIIGEPFIKGIHGFYVMVLIENSYTRDFPVEGIIFP